MAADALEAAADLVSADARTRDVALFRSAEDVLRHLDEFYGPPRPPQLLDVLRGQSLEGLRAKVLDGQGNPTPFGRAFGDFRNVVLTYEETCARRLDVLRATARTLERLLQSAHDAPRIERMQAALATFMVRSWRMDLPLGDIDRNWALRVSRRYDLLPPTWRAL